MVAGYEFFKGPWHEVDTYVTDVEKYYAEYVTARGLGTIGEVTQKKVVERRKWTPSLPYFSKNFETIREELGIIYVPKQMEPGPCVVFPQYDYHDRRNHGKVNTFYELQLRSGPAKYGFLGKKDQIAGPMWFGNTDVTLLNIAKYRSVALVEGFFDLFATRLLHPDTPVLSTGTKSINDMHIQYLRMLGVQDVQLMFDNEPPKEGKVYGAGEQAMRYVKEEWERKTNLKFHIQLLPNEDPSKCLESYEDAKKFRNLLRKIYKT